MSTWLEWRKFEEYRRSQMNQAENERLANSVRAASQNGESDNYRPLLAGLGKQLVALGERLQHPAPQAGEVTRRLRTEW